MSQKNDKKIPESAEELNDYIRVTTPSVWIILLAVGTFVLGLVVWSLTANLVTSVPAAAVSDQNGSRLFVNADSVKDIKSGTKVIINEQEYSVMSVSDHEVTASSVMNEYERSLISAKADDPVCTCMIKEELPAGDYNAMIVTGTDKPISFLFRSAGK